MRAFLEENSPRFIGLTGSKERIEEARAAFRVFARRAADPEGGDDYVMAHTAITFVLDAAGAYAAHFPDTFDEKRMAE